ncbi:hypothetical protein PHISCL_09299 [Aspergillus sclerotialis]|uniref:BED-type domain-containing protein n=1 Tax=Aspergillus sclerotialis TaxID=2070753 RepID=A0A3A2Z5J0_9EURO|nr:hypothetical protein PHISCL_09299 [Aspergillus sclerotialis]
MTKNDFVRWWLQTDFGQKKPIRWDSRHQSEIWTHFDQVATAKDGTPKVMCKRCKRVFDHLQFGNGTSAMLKYMKGRGCQKGAKTPDIREFTRTAVSKIA